MGVGLTDRVEGNDLRSQRRQESQAQCLAVAMQNATRPRPLQEYVDAGMAIAADEIHWDAGNGLFWVKQGLLGRVGECNTYIADLDLVSYNIDG